MTLADAVARLAASPSRAVNGEAMSHEPPSTGGYLSLVGKVLASLDRGCGLIPVLVSLR